VQPQGQVPLRRQPLADADHAELDDLQHPLDGLLERVALAHRAEHRIVGRAPARRGASGTDRSAGIDDLPPVVAGAAHGGD
jgi:hypothetical protein